jgi:hypothetical protein
MRLTQLYDQEYAKPTPVAGDVIEIQLPNDTVVETTIAGIDSEGNVLVHLDETAINMIEQRGLLAESVHPVEAVLLESEDSPVASAITRRIMLQRTDLLQKYGPKSILSAIDDVADWIGDVDEIGSSDISGWVKQVERMLEENPPEAFGEAAPTALRLGAGAALGALSGSGGVIIGSMLGGIFAPILGGYAGYSGAKLGMQAADDIWDWAAKKLGGNQDDFAMSHIRAAASGKDNFEFNGKEFPVTLPKTDVSKAIKAVKQVAESQLVENANVSSLDAVFNEHDFYKLEHIWPALEAGDTKEVLRQINHYLHKGKNRAWWGDLQAIDITINPDDIEDSKISWSKPVNKGMAEAKYHGRDVQLGKPVRGGPKKFYVYVRDPQTKNIKKVNFGDPNMSIKKHSPKHRKSFRARHNCKSPGPRTKARYWSCRAW